MVEGVTDGRRHNCTSIKDHYPKGIHKNNNRDAKCGLLRKSGKLSGQRNTSSARAARYKNSNDSVNKRRRKDSMLTGKYKGWGTEKM